MDPASGGYPLIDGLGVQQQQQQQILPQNQLQQQGGQQLKQQQIDDLIDDAIGIQGQDQSEGGALLGGMLSRMSSLDNIAPPPSANTAANTAGQRYESTATSQDFSNTAVPSGEGNLPPRIEDGIKQSQQAPATSTLEAVAESSPQGPIVNNPQANESPPLADGTNFVTASTIASTESQSFSTVNNTADINAEGQVNQTTGNAQWPSQQEQERQQAVQPAVQQQVPQPIQATQQQLMMNAMLTNPTAQLQAVNPQAYYLWLCQQAQQQQPIQALGVI